MSLVLWSGGLDSTLALYYELTSKKSVRTITINHNKINSNKQEKEKKARKEIKAKLLEEGYNFHSFEINIEDNDENVSFCGLTHPIIWLPQAIFYLEPNEDLIIGWIRGDDIWHYKTHVEQIFWSMLSIMEKDGCRLSTPLEFENKYDVLSQMKKYGLEDICWWCEEPTSVGMSCGSCDPCKNYIMASYYLKHMKNIYK